MTTRALPWLFVCASFGSVSLAHAEERAPTHHRYALIVASNVTPLARGGDEAARRLVERPLAFSDDDAIRMLQLVDDLRFDHIALLFEPDKASRENLAKIYLNADPRESPPMAAILGAIEERARTSVSLARPVHEALDDALLDLRHRISADHRRGETAELLFYFSGHGLPFEAGGRYGLADDWLPSTHLIRDLNALAADRTLLIVDACYSNFLGHGGVAVRGRSRRIRRPKHPPGVQRQVLVHGARLLSVSPASGRGGGRSPKDVFESHEWGEWQSGVFTYLLVAGLRGLADTRPPDGRISFRELDAYMQVAVQGVDQRYRPSPGIVSFEDDAQGLQAIVEWPTQDDGTIVIDVAQRLRIDYERPLIRIADAFIGRAQPQFHLPGIYDSVIVSVADAGASDPYDWEDSSNATRHRWRRTPGHGLRKVTQLPVESLRGERASLMSLVGVRGSGAEVDRQFRAGMFRLQLTPADVRQRRDYRMLQHESTLVRDDAHGHNVRQGLGWSAVAASIGCVASFVTAQVLGARARDRSLEHSQLAVARLYDQRDGWMIASAGCAGITLSLGATWLGMRIKELRFERRHRFGMTVQTNRRAWTYQLRF